MRPSKDSDAKWGHRTAKNARSYKARSPPECQEGQGQKGHGRPEGEQGRAVPSATRSVANHGCAAETRPANASDGGDDQGACPTDLSPQYGDKGSCQPLIPVIASPSRPANGCRQRLPRTRTLCLRVSHWTVPVCAISPEDNDGQADREAGRPLGRIVGLLPRCSDESGAGMDGPAGAERSM